MEEKRLRNYTTQMDAARKGIVTKQMEIVAKKEHMTADAVKKAGWRKARLQSVQIRITNVLIRKAWEACSAQRSMLIWECPATVKTMILRWKRS